MTYGQKDLVQVLFDLSNQLTEAIRQFGSRGRDFAEAESDYKQALTIHALRMKDEGKAVGMITLTIYGIPEIARLRLKRDIAQTMYEQSKEIINGIKTRIRIIEGQVQREWNG